MKLLSGDCHRTSLMRSNIGSGIGFVPSNNKPLLEPVLTQIYAAYIYLYPRFNEVERAVYWFHVVRQLELTKLNRPDLHHVVGLFILRDVRPSICPFVCGENCVRSVTFTVIAGSISYLHSFRRCVAYRVFNKILKFEFLANFSNL